MFIEDVKSRLNEVVAAIEQAAAQVNLLIGRREELKHIIEKMEQFEEDCNLDGVRCAQNDTDSAVNAEASVVTQ